MDKESKLKLFNQQYRLVGNHTVVKTCYWCKEAITKGRECYKGKFFQVHTLQCLEMSPALVCNQRCLHCWRDTSLFSDKWDEKIDTPKEIVDGCIIEREKLLMGFGGNDKVSKETFEKCKIPDHAAISLTGEPTMYPLLPELIKELFDRNFKTVFLVTNGTRPDVLKKIQKTKLPTNIYLSLEVTNKQDYITFCKPYEEDQWEKIIESMKLLSTFNCRTLLRITVVKGYNMHKAKEFKKFIEIMKPQIVEPKGYSFLGHSRERLKKENEPTHKEVKQFAKEICDITDYNIVDEVVASTVVRCENKIKKKII